MRRNLYIAAFVTVLLVACVGGFVGGRVLLSRLQGDFAPRPNETATPSPQAIITRNAGGEPATQPAAPVEGSAEAPAPTEAPAATRTVLVVAAPVTDQPLVLTTEPTWTPGVEVPTSDARFPSATPLGEDVATPEPSATPISDYPYVLVQAVRYTTGDCPGTYALGTVTDLRGNPLPGIRLSLVDEFGNAETAVTKPGPGDTGHYDFPMGGPARRFYMTIVDDANRPLSPPVEILHDLAPYEGKGCRWVDWRRNEIGRR